jgi:ribonuclease PH
MKYTKRIDRKINQLRNIKIIRNFNKYAEGSVLIECGNTKIICNATIENKQPNFLKDTQQGFITAEYSMLPRATHTRNVRDSVAGKISSRSQEISRLIGRSLRNAIDLNLLGPRQIIIDCDVIQADGGTRVTAINGSFIALYDAINKLLMNKVIKTNPIKYFIAAISVGIVNNELLLDLDYNEDSSCDTDLNLVMNDNLDIIEIQGTAEGNPLNYNDMNNLIELGKNGIKDIIKIQKKILAEALIQ